MTRRSDEGRSISARCGRRCLPPAMPSSPSTASRARRSPATTPRCKRSWTRGRRPPARSPRSRCTRLVRVSEPAVSMSARRLKAAVAGMLVIGLLTALVSAVARDRSRGGRGRRQATASAEVRPGGSDYTHRAVRVSCRWQRQPMPGTCSSRPGRGRRKAPLAVVMHGYGEFSGYASMSALIRHTVRKGSIAIYPRWQTGIATPCPGPVSTSSRASTRRSTASAAPSPTSGRGRTRVQPQLAKTSYFGFSFGGIVTANLTNRYRKLHLPKPRAIFLDDPHDGALTGFGEPALDDSLSGIPSTREAGVPRPRRGRHLRAEPGRTGRKLQRGLPDAGTASRNRNKDLVLTHTDAPRQPAASRHPRGVRRRHTPASRQAQRLRLELLLEGLGRLRSCAYHGTDCRYALGNTRQHRSNGRWSDGVPVAPLKIQDAAPIRP